MTATLAEEEIPDITDGPCSKCGSFAINWCGKCNVYYCNCEALQRAHAH